MSAAITKAASASFRCEIVCSHQSGSFAQASEGN